MKIAFVRHANTVAFENNKMQSSDAQLSQTGIEQSKRTGKYFKGRNIDMVISGPDRSAIQTAEILSTEAGINLNIIVSDLFKEILRPSNLQDKYTYDPEVITFYELSYTNQHNENWTYSDDESFNDIKERAKKAIYFILSQKKEDIVVVSHITILVHIICHLIFGEKYNTHIFIKLKSSLKLEYSGIIEMELWQNVWMLSKLVNG